MLFLYPFACLGANHHLILITYRLFDNRTSISLVSLVLYNAESHPHPHDHTEDPVQCRLYREDRDAETEMQEQEGEDDGMGV